MRRLVTCWMLMAIAAVLVAGRSPVIAGGYLGIEDSPEPFPTGNAVSVTVKNGSSETLAGQVVVYATVDGQTVKSSATVTVKGGATETVMVAFGSKVGKLVGVGVIQDDPDPWPMP